MKIAVVGSRSITDVGIVAQACEDSKFEFTEIISGGAKGVDTIAIQLALALKIPYKIYLARWKEHGKGAGMIRNAQMVEAADAVVAIWDRTSRGTKATIDMAKKAGKPCYVKEAQS